MARLTHPRWIMRRLALYGRKRFTRKPEGYSCYWVALHFASAEDAARYLNETVLPARMEGRLLRGGEALPICQK